MTNNLPFSRDPLVDSIRAFALFGVILMNISALVMRFIGAEVMRDPGPLDIGTMMFDLLLFQGKARSCFAFMFGLGFAVLMARAEQQGTDFAAAHLRRMAALLLIGLVNQAFFFWGDILVLYALLGACLLPFRHASDRTVLRVSLTFLVLPPVAAGLVEAWLGRPLGGIWASPAGADAATFAVLMSGSLPEVVAANLPQTLLRYATDTAHMAIYAASVFGMFLLGLWSVRQGIPFAIGHHRALLKRVAAVALPIGFVISSVHASRFMGLQPEGSLVGVVTAAFVGLPLMAVGLMAALALLFDRRVQAIQRLLAPAGRMTLTNYLASGLIGSLVLYGYGLGLARQMDMTALNLLAVAIFAALTLFSHLWLSAFRMGPAEWVWRSLSELRTLPLRRASLHGAEPAQA